MQVIPTKIPEVKLLEPKVFGDARGFFLESYNKITLANALGFDPDFVQDNHSHSSKHVLRGLHYQIKDPQGKLVRVVMGEAFDVAVDLRKSSPYFGKWIGALLSAENKRMLWIPPGFAHGFLVLSPQADFLYKTTNFYDASSDCCLRWNDPDVAIEWPINHADPILSAKDSQGRFLRDAPIYE